MTMPSNPPPRSSSVIYGTDTDTDTDKNLLLGFAEEALVLQPATGDSEQLATASHAHPLGLVHQVSALGYSPSCFDLF